MSLFAFFSDIQQGIRESATLTKSPRKPRRTVVAEKLHFVNVESRRSSALKHEMPGNCSKQSSGRTSANKKIWDAFTWNEDKLKRGDSLDSDPT